MPTARQSAKFSAGCRWRVPLRGNAWRARRRPVAAVGQRTLSECSALAQKTVESGAGGFPSFRGYPPCAPTVFSHLRKGRPISGRRCRCGKIPLRSLKHHTCPESGHVPKQDTCPDSGPAALFPLLGSKPARHSRARQALPRGEPTSASVATLTSKLSLPCSRILSGIPNAVRCN